MRGRISLQLRMCSRIYLLLSCCTIGISGQTTATRPETPSTTPKSSVIKKIPISLIYIWWLHEQVSKCDFRVKVLVTTDKCWRVLKEVLTRSLHCPWTCVFVRFVSSSGSSEIIIISWWIRWKVFNSLMEGESEFHISSCRQILLCFQERKRPSSRLGPPPTYPQYYHYQCPHSHPPSTESILW